MAPSLRVGSSEEETGAPSRDPDADACVVCLGEPKSHILVPCGHQCVCGPCAARLEGNCPVCRVRVQMVMHVFK